MMETLFEPLIVGGETGENTTITREKLAFRKKGLLLFTVLYVFFFAAAPYGWGPMQIMLRNDGAFAYLCDEDDEDDEDNVVNLEPNTKMLPDTTTTTPSCPDQIASLLDLPFYAYFSMVLTPFFGHVVDSSRSVSRHGGSLDLMRLACVFSVVGIAVLVSSRIWWRNADQYLLYVAFALIFMASKSSTIMMVETGLVFDNDDGGDGVAADSKQRRQVISLLNATFDAGTVTYLLLWQINKIGVPFSTVLVGYLVVSILFFGGALFFWTLLQTPLPKDDRRNTTTSNNIIDNNNNNSSVVVVPGDDAEDHEEEIAQKQPQSSLSLDSTREELPLPSSDLETEDYVLVADRPSLQQLRSLPFVMITLFFTLHELRIIFILTSAENFLAYLGDDRQKYMTLFTCLLPVSFVAVPFVDYSFGRFGYYAMFQLVNLLGIVHGTVQVAFTSLVVQSLGFVLFAFYRCFLYSVIYSYLPVFLGRNVLGKGNGLITLFASPVGPLMAVPMADLAIQRRNGNFFASNAINLALILPAILVAYIMGRAIQKEDAAQQRRSQDNRESIR